MTTTTTSQNPHTPFELVPFEPELQEKLSVQGSLSLTGGQLRIQYILSQHANTAENPVIWPPANPSPRRRDGLWQSTCLELFISTPTSQSYWEYNFCPSGDWNIYQFNGYRSGLEEQPGSNQPRMSNSQESGRFALTVVTQLPDPLMNQHELSLGITAVVAQRSGQNSHWALHHGGGEADFHRRDGLRLHLTLTH
jgi:hypothetical protein